MQFRLLLQNKHETLQSVEEEKRAVVTKKKKRQHELECRETPSKKTQMDLHVHLGVAVLDSLPGNHLPQKISWGKIISLLFCTFICISLVLNKATPGVKFSLSIWLQCFFFPSLSSPLSFCLSLFFFYYSLFLGAYLSSSVSLWHCTPLRAISNLQFFFLVHMQIVLIIAACPSPTPLFTPNGCV